MTDQVLEQTSLITDRPPHPGVPVSFDEYMEKYAAHFYEWVDGELIAMSPSSARHVALLHYFVGALSGYITFNPIATIMSAPFAMRVDTVRSGREPDVMVILNDSPSELTETALIGPADVCIEIVSPESVERDHGKKYAEYEKAGVREYWIIDPIHQETRFYRLNDGGRYKLQGTDATGVYQTPLLPRFALPTNVLWQERLPNMFEAADYMRNLLTD